MTDILIPASGDFDAWPKAHDCCMAIDWDGTCKDTMTAKWRHGFNVAITRIWPQLAPHQQQIDELCYHVNMVDESTAGVQRFVALKIMMGRWAEMGLPVPDLAAFCRAVDDVEARGDQHGTATYSRLADEYGFDDSPVAWSNLSDEIIAEAAREAIVFPGVRETLGEVRKTADVVVVSASKTESVRDDLIADGMTNLFDALLAQDFLPKPGTLAGLKRRYERVMFVGDTTYDADAATEAGVEFFRVVTGDEAASWATAPEVFAKFCEA